MRTLASNPLLRFVSIFLGWFVSGCEGAVTSDFESDAAQMPLMAYCDVYLSGIGLVDVETDYLPHVVQCENGAADYEALKAQAVAARSYLYYKLDKGEDVEDGTRDQVYSCGRTPLQDHLDAVVETAGQVIVFEDVTVCGFYVAGAVPSSPSCIAEEGDQDLFNTERFVTYNWGFFGEDVVQTPLGYVHPDNPFNRGCHSQNGAHCLSENGWGLEDILKFYYGMDIGLERGEGICVPDADGSKVDTETDSGADADTDSAKEGETDTPGTSAAEDSDLEDELDPQGSFDSGGACQLMDFVRQERRIRLPAILVVLISPLG